MDTDAWLSNSYCYLMAAARQVAATLAFFLNSGQEQACYMQY